MNISQFRKQVVRNSLFPPRSLRDAFTQLGFVQADPIRSPARAQDLILRHRVKNYKAGDLERSYPDLDLEECFFFAYGFLSRDLWRMVHPRPADPLTDEQQTILSVINDHGPMLPKELETHVGAKRVKNYWGGFSRSAKMALESLHHRGALRVSHRINGHRVYDIAKPITPTLSEEGRFNELIRAALTVMGPTTPQILLRELGHFGYLSDPGGGKAACLKKAIQSGLVRTDTVDNIEYVSLDQKPTRRAMSNKVHILAPFDPIVRDRKRFQHLWNWTYKFEAYTPKAKRKLGYYAMPVLWQDEIIGWANAAVVSGQLEVEFGYVNGVPKGKEFQEAVRVEVERLEGFLGIEGRR